ncbi:hypothetical protein FB45DRAFT_869143 [Roridomyces roridus]|uniref:Uncharacterized protein n=1 Tax=Roridomyces roridus TaxID=1738132 RepID=A0AAD7BNB7_9AGAR|nr:hypothetical protein FB45DRAFT_869143 [Roridomyces roridus]
MFEQYRGSPEAKAFSPEIEQNAGNIKKLVCLGLYRGNPDLEQHIKCTFLLLQYWVIPRYDLSKIMEQIQKLLSQQPDHTLQVRYISMVFRGGIDQALQTPQLLVAQALDSLQHFNDPQVESLLYYTIGEYYCNHDEDGHLQAMSWLQKALTTSKMAGDRVTWTDVLGSIAKLHWMRGQYDAGRIIATEVQSLAKISGNLNAEAGALACAAHCSMGLGAYNQALSDLQRGRQTSELCGPNRAYYSRNLSAEAEIYGLQSEYLKARNVLIQLMLNELDEEANAFAILNVALLDVEIGDHGEADVEFHITTAQKYFSEDKSQFGWYACQSGLASLQLRQHNHIQARTMFEKCLQASWSQWAELIFYVLENLADTTLWNCIDLPWTSRYTVIYLVLSIRHKSKLNLHKALRCLGDVLLSENHFDSAEALFQVALEGFTTMDVHRSRAECMARMGELAIRAGRMDRAEKLWQKACILFERSSQTTQAAEIQRKLADLATRNKDTVLMSRGVIGGDEVYM